jgi:agmatinase
MSYYKLYVSPSSVFAGVQRPFEKADYVIVGAPFDATSTFHGGARFAPLAIREASLNIESYSFRSNMDVKDLELHDLGDLHVSGKVGETLNRIKLVVKNLLDVDKTPVIIGGEHTVTLGAMQAVDEDVVLVSFDAHLDLRSEYSERKVSHTTFMRRIHEKIHPKEILEVGIRAVCEEELDYAERSGIQFLTTHQIRRDGAEKTVKTIENVLGDCENVYLTIDMDVLDPAFAPAVQNPEPDGLSMNMLLDILCAVCSRRVIAFDLVEVSPHYDNGVTAVQAAKILFEALCSIEKE